MGMRRALTEMGAAFASADVLALCYHSIRRPEPFAAQMRCLAERGYEVIALPTFLDWLRGTIVLAARSILLTFDGAYADQLEHAVPILGAHGFPATFFPISGYLDVPGPAMTRRDLMAVIAAGHSIGCHTHTHRPLAGLSDDEMRREVTDSKRRLEDALGERVASFAYPDGVVDARSAAAVEGAGFDVAFTVDLGGVKKRDDRYRLHRVPVLGEPGPKEFAVYLSGRQFVSGAILIEWKMRERLLT